MKKVVVLVVLMVMVALALPLQGATGSAPAKSTGTVGQITGPDDHLYKRRIIVRFEFAGDGYRLYDWFPRYFQTKVAQDGRVDVEVWDQDWDRVTEAQDRINLSGRYSKETVAQVPTGQMHAPTDSYVISVDASIKRVSLNLATSLLGANLSVNDHVTFKVTLNVQPWDIKTGKLQGGWLASGSAKGLDGVSVNSYSSWRGQNFNLFVSDKEKTLEGQAARGAVEDFLRRFKP